MMYFDHHLSTTITTRSCIDGQFPSNGLFGTRIGCTANHEEHPHLRQQIQVIGPNYICILNPV